MGEDSPPKMMAVTQGVQVGLHLYDDHTKPHEHVTIPQLTLFIIWIACLLLYVARFILGRSRPVHGSDTSSLIPSSNGDVTIEVANTEGEPSKEGPARKDSNSSTTNGQDTKDKKDVKSFNVKTPTFDKFLQNVVLFGFIMFYFFLCDYYKVWSPGERTYTRDGFLFMVFLLFLVACGFTVKPCPPHILNRDQTEEWKGWMQVMFVWYHYFAAKEWYNWIRIYIAAYVWMTGFGNFSFFWVRGDFSPWRILKMLFRLNFLVVFVCAVVSNEYMLYYICAMHTYWFLTVYFFMGILRSWNTDRFKMAIKFAVYALANALIFDIPGACEVVFRPLWLILGFHDDRFSLMHEWSFRAGLDHWACFVGMLCAYNYPYVEAVIKSLESHTNASQKKMNYAIKIMIATVAVITLVIWYKAFMQHEKFEYNSLHPYTSWISIIAFIVLRNISKTLRSYHVSMFSWLGKITLETYLSQLHIYLQANAKHLIIYIPGYPLLTFAIATIVYLIISYALFNLTTEFSSFLFPKDYKEIGKMAVYIVVSVMAAAGAALLISWVL